MNPNNSGLLNPLLLAQGLVTSSAPRNEDTNPSIRSVDDDDDDDNGSETITDSESSFSNSEMPDAVAVVAAEAARIRDDDEGIGENISLDKAPSERRRIDEEHIDSLCRVTFSTKRLRSFEQHTTRIERIIVHLTEILHNPDLNPNKVKAYVGFSREVSRELKILTGQKSEGLFTDHAEYLAALQYLLYIIFVNVSRITITSRDEGVIPKDARSLGTPFDFMYNAYFQPPLDMDSKSLVPRQLRLLIAFKEDVVIHYIHLYSWIVSYVSSIPLTVKPANLPAFVDYVDALVPTLRTRFSYRLPAEMTLSSKTGYDMFLVFVMYLILYRLELAITDVNLRQIMSFLQFDDPTPHIVFYSRLNGYRNRAGRVIKKLDASISSRVRTNKFLRSGDVTESLNFDTMGFIIDYTGTVAHSIRSSTATTITSGSIHIKLSSFASRDDGLASHISQIPPELQEDVARTIASQIAQDARRQVDADDRTLATDDKPEKVIDLETGELVDAPKTLFTPMLSTEGGPKGQREVSEDDDRPTNVRSTSKFGGRESTSYFFILQNFYKSYNPTFLSQLIPALTALAAPERTINDVRSFIDAYRLDPAINPRVDARLDLFRDYIINNIDILTSLTSDEDFVVKPQNVVAMAAVLAAERQQQATIDSLLEVSRLPDSGPIRVSRVHLSSVCRLYELATLKGEPPVEMYTVATGSGSDDTTVYNTDTFRQVLSLMRLLANRQIRLARNTQTSGIPFGNDVDASGPNEFDSVRKSDYNPFAYGLYKEALDNGSILSHDAIIRVAESMFRLAGTSTQAIFQ
jgi:hypothetical protein